MRLTNSAQYLSLCDSVCMHEYVKNECFSQQSLHFILPEQVFVAFNFLCPVIIYSLPVVYGHHVLSVDCFISGFTNDVFILDSFSQPHSCAP